MTRLGLWKREKKPCWCEHCIHDRMGKGEVCAIVKSASIHGKNIGDCCKCDGDGNPPTRFRPRTNRGKRSLPRFTESYLD